MDDTLARSLQKYNAIASVVTSNAEVMAIFLFAGPCVIIFH